MKDKLTPIQSALTERHNLSYAIDSTPMATDVVEKEKLETKLGANGKPETIRQESLEVKNKKKRLQLKQIDKLRPTLSSGERKDLEDLQRRREELEKNFLTGKNDSESKEIQRQIQLNPEAAQWIRDAEKAIQKFQKQKKLDYDPDAKDPDELVRIVRLLSQKQKSFDQEVKDFEANMPPQDSPTQILRDQINEKQENFNQTLFEQTLNTQVDRLFEQARNLKKSADNDAVTQAITDLLPQLREISTSDFFKDKDFDIAQAKVGRVLDQVDATAEEIEKRVEAQGGPTTVPENTSIPPVSEQNNGGTTGGGESGENNGGNAGNEGGNGNSSGENNVGSPPASEGNGGGNGRENIGEKAEEGGIPPGQTPERLGFGRINSIEDVAYYMELLNPDYLVETKNEQTGEIDDSKRILRTRKVNGEIMYAFPVPSREGTKYIYEKGTRDHIFQLPRNEVQEIYNALQGKSPREIANMEPDQIPFPSAILDKYVNNSQESEQKLDKDMLKQLAVTIMQGAYEEVRVVDTANFMNWIRDKWVLLHNDDPDNPQMNFFQGIAVDHPDMVRGVSIGQIHQNPGTFLRSKFLTDEEGQRVVYKNLRQELIKEVWITGSFRNYEVLFKQVMPIDEQLFKTFRDNIASGNLYAKDAGGKSTMATLFSFPENFQEDFDFLTGEKADILHDTKLGNSILLSYLIYFNVSDIEKLKELLGNKQTLFKRDSIVKAISDVLGGEKDESKIKAYLATTNGETILDKNIFDAQGNLDLSGENGKKNIQTFMDFFNPFVPAQKDQHATLVIRKMIENQVQEITGIRSGGSGSQFGELLAWLMVYHTGAAARHDMPMNNRNSQAKYEFVQAYKDKQLSRDAAGNIYNFNTLKRAVVGMMTGMPTRRGETIMSVLDDAEKTRRKVEEEYEPLNDRVEKAKSELEETDEMKRLRQEEKALQGETKIQKAKEIKELLNKKIKGELNSEEFKKYMAHENLHSTVTNILSRLEFDDAQFTQYAGMQYTNGAQLFLDDMSGADMPVDKISGVDHEGRRYIKADSFAEWIQGVEKRMRYTISTWPLPLGSTERRLVNARGKGAPEFKEMTMCETIFGHKHSPVLQMFQEMLEREVKEANKKRKPGEKKLDPEEFKFADKHGTVTDAGREKLKKILGYVETTTDENGNTTVTKHESNVNFTRDPADRMLVKAYVKVRIGRFIQSHTDEASPYETWEVPLREGFFGGLKLSRYFTSQDVEDIRKHSHNGYWSNFMRESRRGLGKGFKEGFGAGFSAFLKAVRS